MRVLLKFEIDCDPDAAWRALKSPAVFREVCAPLLDFSSLEPGGFPQVWDGRPHRVEVHALGRVPMGEQTIDIDFGTRKGVRAAHDTGTSLSGALAIVSAWDHTMAVSEARGGRTLYRDRLIARPAAVWPALWTFWQWRAAAIRRLAPTWA